MTALDAATPLLFQTARALRNALDRREISAVELLDEQLAHYEAVNPAINAIVATDPDAARAAARAADAAIARGDAGPLAGIPMTIKDVFEVVGMPATCGFTELAGHYPERDADAVAALRAAGAVIWGKSNVPTGAVDHQTVNPVYGLTRNPWNHDHSPGGSSGGAAAAVAAGITSLELGSDIGGSIRVPSHFSGVYGMKPSFGVVSGRGHIPPMPGARGKTPLGVYGPMARSAFDLEWMLDLIVGPDDLDRKAFSITLPPARQERLRDFRVGVWLDAYPIDDGYRAAIETMLASIERAGGQVDRKARPDIDPANQYETYLTVLMALEGAGATDADYAAQLGAGRDAEPGSYAERIGTRMSQNVRSLGAGHARQEELINRWNAFFRDYDLLICPIFPRVAFPHAATGDGHMAQYDRKIIVNGQPIPYLDGLMWPGMATLPGLPAAAVPTGELVEGLPTAVQIIGPSLEDRTPLRFAQLLETAIGSGYRIPPAYR
ncbi:MAG TPA: amidase [Sphingobium sp.]|nr:amidase [Sphingobium sp.]